MSTRRPLPLAPLLFGALACLLLPSHARAAEDPRVAVLELRQRAGLTPAEADYLTDLVRGVAGARGDLFVLTRENIVELLPPGTELAACEGDCEVETGRRLGVDFVVSGEIVDFADELRILLRLHATRTGALLASERAAAPRIAAAEAPLESAARALVARIGGGPSSVAAAVPRPPAIAPARVEPRSAPRVPVALFLQREPLEADGAAWKALDAELAALVADGPPTERAALLERRGLLAWRFTLAERVRAFEGEDRCLSSAADAAARAACHAARAERVRAARGPARLAIEQLGEALRTPGAGQQATALLAIADAHRLLGDRDAARATIDRLATRHPDRLADGRLLLGAMFFDEGKDAFAETALERLIKDHRGSSAAPFARYLLAWTHIRRGRHDPAVAWLKRVLTDTADARADHPADRPWALLRREARIDLVRAWSDQKARRLNAAWRLFAEVDPSGALHLPEALAEMYAARGRRADARAVLERLRGELEPRCGGGSTDDCATLERLCARHGGAACR